MNIRGQDAGSKGKRISRVRCLPTAPAPMRWTDHIDIAIAELRDRDRSPFEQRAYDVLRSMFGHKP